MITYRELSKTPAVFRTLTGLSVAEADALCREFVHAEARARASDPLTRQTHKRRKRAPGAGAKYHLDAPTRVLMALVWLKLYPTWAVLGYLFGVEETTARRDTKEVLALLEGVASFPLEERPPRRPPGKHGRTLEQVLEQCPAVEILVDAKEQRIRRPTGWEAQKPFYSGKKKTHTLKSQLAVDVEGHIQSVSASVCGSTHDLTLLRSSGLLDRLEPTEGVGADKGYIGIERDHPAHTFYLPHRASKRHPLSEEEKSYNRLLSSVRIAIEHVFARMNRFQALAQGWRHRRARHSGVVRVVAWLVERQQAAAAAAPA
jgi:hypothetical protein